MFLFGKQCKEYKLVNINDIDVKAITDSANPVANMLLGDNRDVIMQVVDIVGKIDFTESTIASLMQKITQWISATAAAVASMGAGGDMIVNSAFTVKHAITFLARIIKVVDNIAETVVTRGEDGVKIDESAILLLMDIFNINFNDGSSGVKCWVEQIIKKYDNDDNSRNFVCELVKKVYPNMVRFISNLIGSSVPDLGVAAIELIERTMMSNFGKGIIMSSAIGTLEKQYKRIPKSMRNIIRDPKLLSQTLKERLEPVVKYIKGDDVEKKTKGSSWIRMPNRIIMDYAKSAVSSVASTAFHSVISDEQFNNFVKLLEVTIEKSDYIAYLINKLIAFTFAGLYFVRTCKV